VTDGPLGVRVGAPQEATQTGEGKLYPASYVPALPSLKRRGVRSDLASSCQKAAAVSAPWRQGGDVTPRVLSVFWQV
jgi:hypothetical protein